MLGDPNLTKDDNRFSEQISLTVPGQASWAVKGVGPCGFCVHWQKIKGCRSNDKFGSPLPQSCLKARAMTDNWKLAKVSATATGCKFFERDDAKILSK